MNKTIVVLKDVLKIIHVILEMGKLHMLLTCKIRYFLAIHYRI